MKRRYTFALGCLAALSLLSCSSDDDATPGGDGEDIVYTSGSADFSTFVSVGNSLTAGYADAALSIQGQEDSYPNILAQQFMLAGGGAFTQPLMNDNLGGATLGGQQILSNRLILSFATGSPSPVPVTGTPTTEITNALTGSFNNMGVPGAKSFHLVANGYGNVAGVATGQANPYFARFASSSSTSIMADAMAQSPTFFSLWIGNNDILSYAMGGGTGEDQLGNTNPASYGSEDITDPNVFASVYNGLLNTLTSGGAKGVVANLPDITTIPYFTTVPYNPVPLDAATAAFIMSSDQINQYNAGLVQFAQLGYISEEERSRRTLSFQAGQNAMLMIDEDLTDLTAFGLPNYRQTTSDDLIVFTAQTVIGTEVGGNPQAIYGVSVPLDDEWVLTPEEQMIVNNAHASFNATIESLATQYGLAFVDVEEIMNNLANGGITVNGSTLTSTYATGGAFSLDGVHPSARGYAYLANQFIAAINSTYGANLPEVNPLNYTALYLQ